MLVCFLEVFAAGRDWGQEEKGMEVHHSHIAEAWLGEF